MFRESQKNFNNNKNDVTINISDQVLDSQASPSSVKSKKLLKDFAQNSVMGLNPRDGSSTMAGHLSNKKKNSNHTVLNHFEMSLMVHERARKEGFHFQKN